MSTEHPAEVQPTTAIYTVTWSDDTDPEIAERFTPAIGRPTYDDAEPTAASWLMVGCRLRRFIARLAGHDVPAGAVEFALWTDPTDIAARFAESHGLPGRVWFDLMPDAKATEVSDKQYGGRVSVVESDITGGVKVEAVPLEIGKGWVALVAHTSPVWQVLAVPVRSAAVATAYMLGSDCRRSRSESLLAMAADARGSYGSFVTLLDLRKASRGLDLISARAVRLGELLGLEAAVPCPSLYSFAERNERATISVMPEHTDKECGRLADGW